MTSSSQVSPWVDGLTIGEMLHQIADRVGDREAVVFPRVTPAETLRDPAENGECFRLTFRELDARVDKIAKALIGLVKRVGDEAERHAVALGDAGDRQVGRGADQACRCRPGRRRATGTTTAA